MAATTFLLLFALLGIASTQRTFYGESISFMPLQKNEDGTFKVSFYNRENGWGSCETQLSYTCDNGACISFENTQAVQTDKDNSGQDKWCQSEGHTTATISSNTASFSVSYSSCCWVSNINGKGNWSSHAMVDLGIRNDTGTFNKPPVTTTVASLRVPQNCFSSLPLLAYDPDGDHVRCRFTASVGANVTLDENECTVKSQGQLGLGVHVFELVLEDYSTKDLTLSYADGTSATKNAFNRSSDSNSTPVSQVAVQFALEILPPLPNCAAGHVQFLSTTPSHGAVFHATVGVKFQLYVQAQAHHAKINDFQLSGPQNMTKEFKDDELGKAEVIVSWTPELKNLHQFVPLCFTAETNDSQSEMRCVVVMVTKSSVTEGEGVVKCSSNQMTVTIEKATVPDIDTYLPKLKDPTCSLTSNDTHIMGTMSFSACGTEVEDTGDFIVFKNEIRLFDLANITITRRKHINIGFSCQFPKTITISNNYQVHKSDYIFTESKFGSFGYSFEIFTNSNFTTKVAASAYPVEVKLLEMIYMGIQAESELTDVTLFVEWCKATPEDNPESNLSYSLIKDGCLQDETVKVHSPNTTTFMFEVQAFKFTGNYDEVYITCSVILCETGNPFSRCAEGCLQNPSRKRKRSLYKQTASHSITQGPLRVIQEAIPNGADEMMMVKKNDKPIAVNPPEPKATGGHWGIRAILSTSMSTVVIASLFITAVAVLAVASCYIARKRRAEDRVALLVTEWEN